MPECDRHTGAWCFFSLLEHCRKHKYLAKTGETFVSLVVRLMERLLDYRTIMHDENKENRMSCTVNVLVSGARGAPGRHGTPTLNRDVRRPRAFPWQRDFLVCSAYGCRVPVL